MIVTLPGPGMSRAAASRGTHWIKRLDRVDRDLVNGFAFLGEFTAFRGTVEVPDGTYFLSYAEDRSYSGRLHARTVRLLRAEDGIVAEIRQWELGPEAGWALKVRDPVAAVIAATPPGARPADARSPTTEAGAP